MDAIKEAYGILKEKNGIIVLESPQQGCHGEQTVGFNLGKGLGFLVDEVRNEIICFFLDGVNKMFVYTNKKLDIKLISIFQKGGYLGPKIVIDDLPDDLQEIVLTKSIFNDNHLELDQPKQEMIERMLFDPPRYFVLEGKSFQVMQERQLRKVFVFQTKMQLGTRLDIEEIPTVIRNRITKTFV